MWETIRGYLTFTRKERFGVLFLLVIISLLFVLPYFFRPEPGEPDPEKYEKMKTGILTFESAHADSFRNAHNQNREASRIQEFISPGKRPPKQNRQLFYFDPNKLNPDGWQQLGLTDHLAQTIVHFIEKGGRFLKPEDLKKIYGLHATEYERLFPYVRIPKEPGPLRKLRRDSVQQINNGMPGETMIPHVSKKLEITDINEADSSQWCRLPGIGAKLASRIVNFRARLGGFYQVDQVGETFGLPDSTFKKIRPVLVLNAASVILIDLDNASKESLQLHPYIRWQMAKAIIAYRNQHGNFQSVDELMQLAIMDSVKFAKLKPYLSVHP